MQDDINIDPSLIWAPATITTPELRLYYDAVGAILFYTCDKPEGMFIVVDKQTYAEGRHDRRVVDGQLVAAPSTVTVFKLVQSQVGIKCASEDISIIVDDTYIGNTINWEVCTSEFKYN